MEKGQALQTLTNTTAEQSPLAFDLTKLKLIDYNLKNTVQVTNVNA
ncbi:AfuA protein [Actinobacillus equuli]|nr:AfuA protein [Actinobacillus equuli]